MRVTGSGHAKVEVTRSPRPPKFMNHICDLHFGLERLRVRSSQIILDAAMNRPAGPIKLQLISDMMPRFKNRDLIEKDTNLAGKSDYMRLEILYLYGGIYLDTDAKAVHGFDDFGTLFRWPFVCPDPRTYHNLGNCVLGIWWEFSVTWCLSFSVRFVGGGVEDSRALVVTCCLFSFVGSSCLQTSSSSCAR